MGATAPRGVVDFWGMKGDLRQGVGFGGGRGFFISTHFDEQRTYEDFAIRIAKPCSRAEIAHCMARLEPMNALALTRIANQEPRTKNYEP